MAARSSSLSVEDFGAAVWRADALACATGATLASGHGVLDAELPGGGWPVGAMSEILQAQTGWYEWRLLLPALARSSGVLVLVGAPHVPFGPGLAAHGLDARRLLWVRADAPDARLWAAEQALRCAEVSAVLVWLAQVRAAPLRRLHFSASAQGKLLFVMRPLAAQAESSPAALRLLLGGEATGRPTAGAAVAGDALRVHILKRRGTPLEHALLLSARPAGLAVLLALQGDCQAHDQQDAVMQEGSDPGFLSWTRPSGLLAACPGRRDNAAGSCPQGGATTPGALPVAQSGV